jgi:hypothetical protein
MQVHITSLTFDLQGAVSLDLLPETDLGETRRRMNRIATLDGGAAVNDFGHSVADRTLTLNWKADEAVDALMARLVRVYGRLRVSMRDGVFLVAPELHRVDRDVSTARLLVLEQLT